jgi:hypothetical protein
MGNEMLLDVEALRVQQQPFARWLPTPSLAALGEIGQVERGTDRGSPGRCATSSRCGRSRYSVLAKIL